MDECVKNMPFVRVCVCVCVCVYRHVKIESKMVVTESWGGARKILYNLQTCNK